MHKYNYHDFLATLGFGGAHPGGIALTKELLKDIRIDQNSKILDAGCGTGQTSAYLVKTYGCHVTAVDSHPVMLQKAQARFSKEGVHVNLVQGDLENIPLVDASFDLVLAESVTVFTNIAKTACEYARLLRKEGILIDLEMTAVSPFSEEVTYQFTELYGMDQIPTARDWKDKFLRAGFQSIEIVKENSVVQALHGQFLETDYMELSESDSIDPSIYHIWNEHQLLTEKYSDRLNYNVYSAIK